MIDDKATELLEIMNVEDDKREKLVLLCITETHHRVNRYRLHINVTQIEQVREEGDKKGGRVDDST